MDLDLFTPWQNVSLQTPFTGNLQVRLIGSLANGMLELKGSIDGQTTDLDVLCILPVGYRPANNRYLVIPGSNGSVPNVISNIIVTAGGSIVFHSVQGVVPSKQWFDGCTFAAN
jgi:hypothetical protein